jgi:hypothetical protein
MQPDHTETIEQLRAAFPAKPIQSEGAFQERGAGFLDAATYKQQIEGKTWEELDPAYLVMHHDALSVLGTRHLVAVLPVYLRSLVEEGVESLAAYALLHALTRRGPKKKPGTSRSRFDELVDALTPAQRVVIATVLRAFAATDESGSLGFAAQAALEEHWKTYLPAGA